MDLYTDPQRINERVGVLVWRFRMFFSKTWTLVSLILFSESSTFL